MESCVGWCLVFIVMWRWRVGFCCFCLRFWWSWNSWICNGVLLLWIFILIIWESLGGFGSNIIICYCFSLRVSSGLILLYKRFGLILSIVVWWIVCFLIWIVYWFWYRKDFLKMFFCWFWWWWWNLYVEKIEVGVYR